MKRFLTTASFGTLLGLSLLLVPALSFAADPKVQPTSPSPQSSPTAQPSGATSDKSGAATSGSGSGDSTYSNGTFVPLTQLPGIPNVASASSLPAFFNQLYKICIGAAATIAVLQIMIAGVQFMMNRGSVSTNEAAKGRIQNAILGLVLVLSPYIVFSIINPNILKLDLDFSNLKSSYQSINPNSVGVSGGSSAAAQISAAAANGLTSCDIPVTDAQKTCVTSGIDSIVSKFNQCIAGAVAGGSAVTTCFDTARTNGRSTAKSCVPNMTDTQASCLEGQLTSAFETYAKTNGKSTGSTGGCLSFANPGTTVINTDAAQTCCSNQSGCSVVKSNSATSCKCVSSVTKTHTPSVSYVYEDNDYSSDKPNAKCYQEGQDTYPSVEACTAAVKASKFNTAGNPRGAIRNSCTQDAFDYVPGNVYYDLTTKEPACK